MNLFKKATTTFILGLMTLASYSVYAGVDEIPGSEEFRDASVQVVGGDSTIEKASNASKSVLSTAKVILNGLAVIYIVYVGIMMVIAYGDEWQLAKQKGQLMYGIVAFLFVNIPGQIYNIFTAGREQSRQDVTGAPTNSNFVASQKGGTNIFVNFDAWNSTIENGVLAFIRIGIIGIAIFFFTLAGFKLIVSGGNDEARKKAKNQIMYGFLALIFLGIIQAWVNVAYSGNIPSGQSIFTSLANLALFFAGPTAIFFLTLGAWHYIMSAGDEEKAKKGKSIVINTFIAVIILLASYTFLKDLADFKL